MRRTRWVSVLACFIIPGLFTWLVATMFLRSQGYLPQLSLFGAIAALVIAIGVLIAGLGVRRLKAHERTWMTPTGAAMTAVGAQASIIVGAGAGGCYCAMLLLAIFAPSSPAVTELIWKSALCLAACVVWVIVGFIVESWCSVDYSDDDTPPGGSATA